MPSKRFALVFLALAWSALAVLAISGCSSASNAESPRAPEFSLTERSGRTVSSSELEGKAYLANFIFTSCEQACPLMTVEMARVQGALRDAGLLGSKAVLVSFSFDPARDTPQALRKYADAYGADPTAWLFLTGTPEQTRQVVERGFGVFYQPGDAGHAAGGHAMTGAGGAGFTHANVFVLVDGKGNIRAVYTGTVLDVPGVVADIKKVAG